ncbi:MAG: PEP-CTERM sorting domain-containing protein [Phycisphaerae bacterium]|jgi:hypothetical protein
MRKIGLLSLLLVAALLLQSAEATILPYSSHYQGRSYFGDSTVSGHVDFAVYDTLGSHGNEWVGAGFAAPGSDRYIYAYQIFNDAGSSEAIESFTIMGLYDPDTVQHLGGVDSMTSQDPWADYPFTSEGVAPTGTRVNLDDPPTRATWDFAGGILIADGYSWFLVFSSAKDWVEGKYEIGTAGGLPVTSNPEPCTLALLGLGGAMVFRKRRKFVKSRV